MKKFIILSFLGCISFIWAQAQTAGFERNKTEKQFCDSSVIIFTNISVPSLNEDISNYTFTWNFGKPLDGMTKDTVISRTNTSLVNMKFKRVGMHIISLRMVNKNNSDDNASFFDTIRIRPQPNAWFSVADTMPNKPLTYRFRSGRSFNKNDTIEYTYKWYFGNDDLFNCLGAQGKIKCKGKPDSVIHILPNDKSKDGYVRDLLVQTFPEEGFYTMHLITQDWWGCQDSYAEKFYVSEKLHYPQAFTPNGDGKNDYFKAQTNGRDDYNFQVFNSRGLLIFKSESKNIVWDGYDMNGREALPGLYYFVIQSVNADVPVKEVGYVVLIREKK